MTTQTRRCVLCHHPVSTEEIRSIPSGPIPECSVFIDKHESLFGELWAWISVSDNSPLEGLCGLVINGVPHRAIANDFAGALKLIPFLKQAADRTGARFKLVQFVKHKETIRL